MKLVSSTAVFKLEATDLSKWSGVEYEKVKKFNSIKIKLVEGGCSFVYGNGKVVIVGSKNINESAIVTSITTKSRIIEKPIVKNLVFSGKLNKRINLQMTCKNLQKSNQWLAINEPELFPALFAREKKKKPSIQFSDSGSYVITGVSTEQEAMDIFKLASLHLVHRD